MKNLEKELVKLREKVKRSGKLSLWEKFQAYQLIAGVVKLLDLEV